VSDDSFPTLPQKTTFFSIAKTDLHRRISHGWSQIQISLIRNWPVSRSVTEESVTNILTTSLQETEPFMRSLKSFATFCILWDTQVRNSLPLVPALIQSNPAHALPCYFLGFILILSSHVLLVLQSGLLPIGFPNKILYTFLFHPVCDMCPKEEHIKGFTY
jgi:hypothetical protein